MKKTMSLFLAFVLIMSVVNTSVFASELENNAGIAPGYSGEEVLALACAIWPEHADKLTTENISMVVGTSRSLTDEVIRTETYQISENESIQYVEYASGFALAARGGWYEGSHTSGSTYDTYQGNLTVASGISVSYLVNFTYRIYHSSYDKITNFGIFDNSFVSVYDHGKQSTETASSNAYYTYQVYFESTDGTLMGSAIANLTVGDNDFYWSVA